MSSHNLDALLRDWAAQGRVCPQPQAWQRLWDMLPGKHRTGGGWSPPLPLILAGVWLGARAVRAAAGVDLERPDQLVDSGPYARSRNPMYLAWTAGYVGIALVAGTAWPLLLLPVVLVLTHAAVMREERSLERSFGAAYRNYKGSVRRYL